MKKTYLLLAAISVILMMPVLSSCAGRNSTLKVISYNIRMGAADDGDNSWELRKEASTAMIEEQQPDIFGLQEAYDYQVKYLEETCPQYAAIGVGRDDGVSLGEHMEIYYLKDKYNLKEWGTYWLSPTPDSVSFGWDAACRRTATWCLLESKDGKRHFYYVNTHLDHVGVEARINGLALIVSRIADMNKEGWPMVLTGDFNVQQDDPCLLALDGKMLSARATAKKTDDKGSYNGWGKTSQAIDYIFYSGFSKAVSFETLDRQYAGKPFISDHYPVVAVLKF
ncbi:MAG: endonuclease/exonuclease/phosphatase family protein [Bacteroidales bacterium]|nr:endonuclease/exonuclease/phosphatase family protein [Bacteroidales bacterium]